MIRSLLCKLGLHNWYWIRFTTEEQEIENARSEINGDWARCIDANFGFLQHKICANCKKVVNKIEDFKPIAFRKARRRLGLEQLAKPLVGVDK